MLIPGSFASNMLIPDILIINMLIPDMFEPNALIPGMFLRSMLIPDMSVSNISVDNTFPVNALQEAWQVHPLHLILQHMSQEHELVHQIKDINTNYTRILITFHARINKNNKINLNPQEHNIIACA